MKIDDTIFNEAADLKPKCDDTNERLQTLDDFEDEDTYDGDSYDEDEEDDQGERGKLPKAQTAGTQAMQRCSQHYIRGELKEMHALFKLLLALVFVASASFAV